MSTHNVLIADDSLTIQKVIRLALANEGYEIQSYSDGQEALTQLSVFRPDAVLIDAGLSGKNAFDLKREVNQDPDLRGIRFILMSSAFKNIDEEKVKELGFQGRLVKPFDPAHLRQVLSSVLSVGAAAPAPSVSQAAIDPPPMNLMEPESPDEDIKVLTESTIKMSGLDDFEWSVQEPAADAEAKFEFEEPTIAAPSEKMFDLGSDSFEASSDVDAPKLDFERDMTFKDLAQTDFMSMTPPELLNQGSGVDDASSAPAVESVSSFEVQQSSQPVPELDLDRTMDVSGFNLSENADLEALIRKQVQATLEKMTHQLAERVVPDIAERIIKEEIHKLLSNPPN